MGEITDQIDFRLMQVADRESYRKIRLECLVNYPHNFVDSYEEEVNADPLKFDKIFLADDDHSFLFGAFSQTTLVGICGFIQQKRIKARHRGDLVQVYVQPAYGGKGIGRHLIELTIEKAFASRTICQVLLSVVYENDKAISLYKKLGFCEYGRIENFFRLGSSSWSQVFMVLTRENFLFIHNSREKSAVVPHNPFDRFI